VKAIDLDRERSVVRGPRLRGDGQPADSLTDPIEKHARQGMTARSVEASDEGEKKRHPEEQESDLREPRDARRWWPR